MTDRIDRRHFTGGLLGAGLGLGRWPAGLPDAAQVPADRRFDVRQFGARMDGRTDDTAALRAAVAAASTAGGGTVALPAGTGRLTGGVALPGRVRLVGEGPGRSRLRQTGAADLLVIDDAPHVEVADLTLEGNAPTGAGRGVVVTGTGSLRPVFRNVVAEGFGGAHLEFGPDAGPQAFVDGWNSRIGGGPEDFVGLRIAGPDSTGLFRSFVGLHIGLGYVALEGAQDTQFVASSFARIETDAATSILTVVGCVWANRGRPMVLSGSVMNVIGCRMAGPVTLAPSYLGSFIGNVLTDTSYALTDRSQGPGHALVLHQPLGEPAMLVGRHRLGAIGSGDPVGNIVTGSTMVAGDGDLTLEVGKSAATVRFTAPLTAPRTVTLATRGARDGARFRVVRSGGGPHPLDVGGLKQISAGTAAWVDVEFDGQAWQLTGFGLL